MATPKVSIIVPVHNVEPNLRERLDSVVGPTLGDWTEVPRWPSYESLQQPVGARAIPSNIRTLHEGVMRRAPRLCSARLDHHDGPREGGSQH
ncbi:MAG: hypothetical protein N2109_13190 [Fimbriimonadales bacterium]|nr:hypothetical protein [Fimbriimonadales bacterium]